MNEKIIKISGGEIKAIEHISSPDSPTILALHGWLDNAASFVPLIDALPNMNWIAIDLPGHGHSFHRANNSYYHFIDWVSDVIEVIDALELNSPPVLVGHSLGGMLATVIAGLYPDSIAKLVLIDSAGLIIQDDTLALSNIRSAMDSRKLVANKQPRIHKSIELAIKARQDAGNLSYLAAQRLIHRNTELVDGGFVWRTDLRLKTGSPIRLNKVAAEQVISSITAKTLVILADEGYQTMKDSYSLFKQCYKRHILLTVDGHHHCHLENPSQTAHHIGEFLL
ncbi:alpha/beta fold hydrolase [Psychrosphaera aestuarii]|uniref:alpha/beta fold hydrolase n=1 Tax=Psychrosphaera aestuarii TaxID=1266052 RepID=UPI001B338E67|nr:alpha/beta hydrolase [Psychrosphaera aestuarii]